MTDAQSANEAQSRAFEWANYRNAYGVNGGDIIAAHKAFAAGWDAAQGRTHEGGLIR